MTETDPAYLGPAVLLQTARFVLDTRDGADEERIALTATEDGVWRCHTLFNCQSACPKNLDPTGAIAVIKRRAMRDLCRP